MRIMSHLNSTPWDPKWTALLKFQPYSPVGYNYTRHLQYRLKRNSKEGSSLHLLLQSSNMASSKLLPDCALLLLVAFACVSAEVVEHTFQVENLTVQRLCKEQVIIAVNGRFPGPTIYAHEGDTLFVRVLNKSPYAVSIHWHGVHMLLHGWADGAGYVTQCPILPGDKYTYKFNITKQEGTLWWHAHVSWLRATVHGALIIYPRANRPYPFQKPYKEFPIVLGEWWNANMVDVEDQFLHENQTAWIADAFTINGQPGDFYQCSSNDMHELKVKQGKTYLLRIINAGLNDILFFKIANHKITVVAVDACYTNPYVTDVVVVAPGQTVDVLLKADQRPRSYYMVTRAYVSFDPTMIFQNTNNTARGIISYEGNVSPSEIVPILPILPSFYDISTIHNFYTSLTGLTTAPFWVPVPQVVDEHMFINVELGLVPCHKYRKRDCYAPFGGLAHGNMNNVSFELPDKMSMLEAFFYNVDGIYKTDFPNKPPIKFDYTNPSNQFNKDLLWIAEDATKVKKLRYNTTIEIVLQNTILLSIENHPIHLHGFDFHVLAQGFGNYDAKRERKNLNLVNPQRRNTVAVPAGGWVVIRFQANNPGVWLMHCHLEMHISVGLATAFVVENGPTLSTSLPPPPLDLPKCDNFRTHTASDQPVVAVPLEKSIGSTSFM